MRNNKNTGARLATGAGLSAFPPRNKEWTKTRKRPPSRVGEMGIARLGADITGAASSLCRWTARCQLESGTVDVIGVMERLRGQEQLAGKTIWRLFNQDAYLPCLDARHGDFFTAGMHALDVEFDGFADSLLDQFSGFPRGDAAR